MSRDNYEEFPELTPEALEALRRAEHCLDVSKPGWNRRYLAAFLLEATKQAHHALRTGKNTNIYESLQAIANNLHSPPPPPPTREQMEQALQSLIDEYGARVAGEWTDAHLQTLSAGIAHYCFVVR